MTKDIEGFYGIKAWVVRKYFEIASEGKYKNYSIQSPIYERYINIKSR